MRFLLLPILFFNYIVAVAAPTTQQLATQYIMKYKEDAIREMKSHGVPASITLAQGMLESDYGRSKLAVEANNHFGIKCAGEWNGPTIIKDDDTKDECFRKYKSVLESYTDHSLFIKNKNRYSFLFDYKVTDYKSWAYGLKKAGYATDPNYPQRLIKIIEENGLNHFDDNSYKSTSNANVVKKENYSPNKKLEIKKPKKLESTKGVNGLKCITVKQGDTYYSIIDNFEVTRLDLIRWNDFEPEHVLQAGEVIYLQPKKRKAKEEYHIVKEGETLHSISQLYGIKLKVLRKKNCLNKGVEPAVGEKLWLRKKKSSNT